MESVQMQQFPRKISIRVKNEENNTADSSFCHNLSSTAHDTVDISSSEQSEFPDENDENKTHNDPQKQLVVYDPSVDNAGGIMPVPDSINLHHHSRFSTQNPRILPSVGAFTVQCAKCFKWRLIPTKEKYEKIREHILENPFICDVAREWRFEISCDDPPDICQDGSRLWAIDKPNIAQPPPGWQRLLHIRGEGSSKFADVYYVAPSGKRLRSMVEVQKYLLSHPQYAEEGASISQFSFQTPKPLQQDYVRKRSHHAATTAKPLPSEEVKPLSWELPFGWRSSPPSGPEVLVNDPEPSGGPSKKQAQCCNPKWELHRHD